MVLPVACFHFEAIFSVKSACNALRLDASISVGGKATRTRRKVKLMKARMRVLVRVKDSKDDREGRRFAEADPDIVDVVMSLLCLCWR